MNENLQSAVSDLSLIRQTMDKSRVQMKRLATLFFLYGGCGQGTRHAAKLPGFLLGYCPIFQQVFSCDLRFIYTL